MNKKWLFPIVMGLAVVLTIPALTGCSGTTATQVKAQQLQIGQQPEGIWVSGSGEVSVTPDVAVLRLGIVAQKATVAEAQSIAAEAMNKVMKALTDGAVPQKDIQTGSFSINQRTRWDNDKQTEVVIGYQVTNMVIARIRVLPQESFTLDYKAGRIIEAVVQAGGDLIRISSINFSVEEPSRHYQQAREKAMADAKNKAEQLAKLAGVTLGRPTFITEGAQSPVSFDSYRSGGIAIPAPMPAAIPPPISPGETRITINVQVAYAVSQ